MPHSYVMSAKHRNRKKARSNKRAPKETRREIKQRAVEYKGGHCQKCGYDRCLAALTFHHLDPAEKDFGISDLIKIASWKTIKRELGKTILLCTNCHAEAHDGYISNERQT